MVVDAGFLAVLAKQGLQSDESCGMREEERGRRGGLCTRGTAATGDIDKESGETH